MRERVIKSGPLAYIDNFPYGDVGNKIMDEITAPVILVLDISKAPRVGEEAVLSCRISSLHDVPDFSAQITFSRRLEDNSLLEMPGGRLLINGDLKWAGNLKQNEPAEFSATIRFPEEGDLEVYAGGNSLENEANKRFGFYDYFLMNLTSDRGLLAGRNANK